MKTTIKVETLKGNGMEKEFTGVFPHEWIDGFHDAVQMLTGGVGVVYTITIKREET